MPHCTREECRRWRPDTLVRFANLGLRVDGEWFCSAACVAAAAVRRLRQQKAGRFSAPDVPPLRLGSLLVHQGVITYGKLQEALISQRISGLRLGAELRRLGYADRDAVLRALASQAGTSYANAIDPAAVRLAPGDLCAEEVRALGVVPIRVSEGQRVLLVACVAPVPWAALGALGALTGQRPVPYLVSDEEYESLMAAYVSGAASKAASGVTVTTVSSMHDAARRIAAAAMDSGSITVNEAHINPLTWIRVSKRDGIDAMLVAGGDAAWEDEEWLAATTRH